MGRILILGILLCLMPAAHADYWPQNDPRSGGMRDLMLLYTTTPDHYTTDDLMPYVAYLDKQHNGRPLDWFYDGYLFLTIGGAPSGAPYDMGATNLDDWRHFLNRVFAPGMNLRALDDAIARAAETLGPPPRKVPVMLMIPYPSPDQKNFGVLEANNHSLDFGKIEDVRHAVTWIVDESARLFADGQYKHVSLWGFYWMKEGINPPEEERVRETAKVVHDRNFGFHWIPWSGANGVEHWRELGFDFVILQPNYANLHTDNPHQLSETAARCRQDGLGIEIEVAERTMHGAGQRENVYEYLNYGLPEYDGYMSAVHGYYQTITDVGLMYANDLPADNRLYHSLYAYHKQTYIERPPPISMGLPCRVILPFVGATGTLALTGATPAPLAQAVEIPGSGGVLVVDLPTDRRIRTVLLHMRVERTRPGTMAFAQVFAQDRADGSMRLIATAANPPALDTEAGFQWWRVDGTPQIGSSVVVQLSGPPGGKLIVDQIRLIPAAAPGLDGTCLTDGTGDGQALTDREYAVSDRDNERLVTWPGGKGALTLGVPDDRYLGMLWLHAVKPPGGQWPSRVQVSYGDRALTAEVPSRTDDWAAYIPVKLPAALAGELRIQLEGEAPNRPVALDEVELERAENLALGRPYTFEPPVAVQAPAFGYPDDGKKLTDGALAETFKDGKLAGGMHIKPSIVIDLGEQRPVDKVRIHAWGGGGADTYFPTSTTVWTADQGQWRPVLQRLLPPPEPAGARTFTKAWLEAEVMVASTRYVRLDFVSHDFLLIDEIEVISKGANVARDRAYQVLRAAPDIGGAYPDDGRKLTDGDVSLGFLDRMKAVGYGHADPTVTVDLQRPEEIAVASAHLCGGGWAGIFYPGEMSVQTSLDGVEWTAPVVTTEHRREPTGPANVPFPPPATVLRTVGMMEVFLDTTARYVRWHFRRHGYCLVDEVEVYGK